MTVQVQTKDAAGTVWNIAAEQYSVGIAFWHTPQIGGAPGFTGANPGVILPYISGAAGFTAANPGAVQVTIGGVVGLTMANPGVVQLSIAGAANAINNPIFMAPANSGAGTDASGAGWTISGSPAVLSNSGLGISGLVLLGTKNVTIPGNYGVMNQDSAAIYVAFDDVAGATTATVIPLDPGIAKGRQGGTADIWPWFTGRIRVFGVANQLFSIRAQ